MRVITNCPSCQTQFFATEAQLNKHGGKVRCGQCMHVFDAKAQLIATAEDSTVASTNINTLDATPSIEDVPPIQSPPKAESTEIPIDSAENTASVASSTIQQPSFLDDATKKSKSNSKKTVNKSRSWLWTSGSVIMVLIAGMQSVYFLRNEIAIYYPNIKPFLVQSCKQLSCDINLPKQIESITIDDSDMQEDASHPGLIHFSSSLINSSNHVLAYPNLELSLTDVNDTPVLRRIFDPNEYLPPGKNIADGIQAGEETRIKLAITTSGMAVSGYRVFVTY